jgi:tol-pal system protein YbgF
MRVHKSAGIGVLAAALLGIWTQPLQAAKEPSQEQRLARLERLLNSRIPVELLDRLERLQQEVQQLRGELELQGHALSQLRERQRELYLDLDRRLQDTDPGEALTAAESRAGTHTAGEFASKREPTVVAPAPAPAGAGADPLSEQSAYEEAFNLLKAGQYQQATETFDKFLEKYPNGKYADNAQYWLGEAFYVTRQFERALQEFNNLLSQHADSPKATHAELKVGYIHDELGQTEEARRVLKAVVARYPNTTVARLAEERLRKMDARAR